MKVLIIEDEPQLLASIKKYLSDEGSICETATEYYLASEKAGVYDYDCIVVDISIPNGSGLKVIEELKKNKSKAGVIIISAKNSLDDKLTGLKLGADDYLTKPFHLPELNARLQAIMRRKNFDGYNEIIFEEIKIDTTSRRTLVNDIEIMLTLKEYDLLLFFIANKNRVVSKNSIAEHLWGDDMDQADSYNFIYTHIKNLRKKMLDKNCRDYIHTIYGIGYNFKTI